MSYRCRVAVPHALESDRGQVPAMWGFRSGGRSGVFAVRRCACCPSQGWCAGECGNFGGWFDCPDWKDRAGARFALLWAHSQHRRSLDGLSVAGVKTNGFQEYRLVPGDHTISVGMDWCWTTPAAVSLGLGEVAVFDVQIPGPLEGLIGAIFWPRRVFGLRRR